MREITNKHWENTSSLRRNLIELSKKFSIFSIFDSNHWQHDLYHNYDLIAAFGAVNQIKSVQGLSSFNQLRHFHQSNTDWLFGYLAYDLKNELEDLQSQNTDCIKLPDMQFFKPEILVLLNNKQLKVLVQEQHMHSETIKEYLEIIFCEKESKTEEKHTKVEIKHRITKQQYITAINHIRQHIKQGDIYELNFCQEFYAEDIDIDASSVFQKLIRKSPTPFSAFQRFNNVYLMSASPERFLQKKGKQIIAQPIKGTARRRKKSSEDLQAKLKLQNDQKERAENIMIVDLVRNDLAHTAKKNSVQVEELCKIYSFEQVHQMISSIRSELDEGYDFVDVLQTCFPMGSMTGAPKIRAMQLIEQYEQSKRGIYSGAVGYITPDGDFDFNVVIRSLVYNRNLKYLSFIAGGAITYLSEAEKEYAESLLKAEAIREILS